MLPPLCSNYSPSSSFFEANMACYHQLLTVQTSHHHHHRFPPSHHNYNKYITSQPPVNYSLSTSLFVSLTSQISQIWLVTTSQLCSNYLPSSSFFSLTSLQLPDQPLAVTLLVTFLSKEGSLWSQKLGLELFLPLVILPCNSTPHPPTH